MIPGLKNKQRAKSTVKTYRAQVSIVDPNLRLLSDGSLYHRHPVSGVWRAAGTAKLEPEDYLINKNKKIL